jgi:hypothetical protein
VMELLKGFVDDPKEFLAKVKRLHEAAGGILVIQHRKKVMWEELAVKSEADGERIEEGLDQYLMQREGYSWNGTPRDEESLVKSLIRAKNGQNKLVELAQGGQPGCGCLRAAAGYCVERFKREDALYVILWNDERKSLLWSANANSETSPSPKGFCAALSSAVDQFSRGLMQEEHQ